TAWRHGHRDGAELGLVHETIWSTKVEHIESVEGFAPKFETGSFGQVKAAHNCEVQRAQGRAIDRVAPHVAEGVGGGGGEGGRIEPFGGAARARAEDRLAGVVGANRVF